MRTILLTCLTALGLLLSVSVMAQTKTVTGTVTDAGTGETLPGVNVVVKGTTVGIMTGMKGEYSIKVSEGQILQFTSIGYIPLEITVGSSNQVDAVLSTDVQTLGEVVVTAEFGMKRVSRSIGSSVQNIKASEIAESGREDFITALQGRVAGLSVESTSGSAGSSTNVVLRSITSISGNNQPLYVVDGVPINNSTFNPIEMAGGENFSVRTLDFSSRGNDINPDDIESMTILKGAAAAALYGSDAANGAIIITTKKGTAGGGKITYSNNFKWTKQYGLPDIQDKYSCGAYGTTNYFYTSRFGGLYPEGTVTFDNVDAVLQTGFSANHRFSIEGGTDKSSIRASVAVSNIKGTVITNEQERLNISIAGKSDVSKWLTFEGNMMYSSQNVTKPSIGMAGPLYMSYLWPVVDDMSQYMDPDGIHMRMPEYYTDTDLLNPIFGLKKNKLYDETDRISSSFAANFKPIENGFIRLSMGWDVSMSTYIASRHPYYSANNAGDGYYNLVDSKLTYPTINLITGYSKDLFNDNISVSAQLGYHQYENGVRQVATNGTNFMVADMHSIINCDPLTISARQKRTKRRIQAISAQFEVGYKNMAYLTFRARNDWSSTLPVANNTYFYPALEASFVVSELSFMKDIKEINYLKLRGAITQVGKDARPLSINPQLVETGLTGGGYRYDYTGPNLKLKPEMTTSKELGLEARILDDRITTDFTYFWTKCDDQIVNGFRLSYATGFVLNTLNVGGFETWGWEWHIDGDIIKQADGLRWNVGLNLSHSESEVTYLPANVSEFYDAYTNGNSGYTRNGIMLGSAITSFTGLPYLRNNNGDVLISPTSGMPVVDTKYKVLGDRQPKLIMGLNTELTYKAFRFRALFAGRYHSTVINGTKRTMMQRGLSWESVRLRESGPVVFNGVLQDGLQNTGNPTENTIAVDYHTYGASVFTGNDEDWIERNVNYVRLQEIQLTYKVPEKMLKGTPMSNTSIWIGANDLFTITNYSGINPAANTMSAAAGGIGGEGFDIWSLPNPRGISVGLSVTFK